MRRVGYAVDETGVKAKSRDRSPAPPRWWRRIERAVEVRRRAETAMAEAAEDVDAGDRRRLRFVFEPRGAERAERRARFLERREQPVIARKRRPDAATEDADARRFGEVAEQEDGVERHDVVAVPDAHEDVGPFAGERLLRPDLVDRARALDGDGEIEDERPPVERPSRPLEEPAPRVPRKRPDRVALVHRHAERRREWLELAAGQRLHPAD